jgi:hypothetical protein
LTCAPWWIHPTPATVDATNQFFTFEAGAAKLSGGQGWADVWYKGHFAIEYKGPDKSLARAYEQLLQYRESLQNPPLLVTGNTQEFFIHTNFTNSVKRVIHVTLDDLLTPQGLQHIRNLFYNPEAFRPEQTAAQVTEEPPRSLPGWPSICASGDTRPTTSPTT